MNREEPNKLWNITGIWWEDGGDGRREWGPIGSGNEVLFWD